MIDKICEHFNIEADQILASRETADSIIVVINYGIHGGKKFTVAKSDLVTVEPKPVSRKAESSKRPAKKKG